MPKSLRQVRIGNEGAAKSGEIRMTSYESLFRCFLGIAAIAHNNPIIFGPKFSQAHRFALLMEAESKPIHDVDICKIESLEFLDRV